MSFVITDLIIKKGVPDVFHHPRHGQNIVLAFLIVLCGDAIVEHLPFISNRPESAKRESAPLGRD